MKFFLSGIVVSIVTILLDQYSKYYIFSILLEKDRNQMEIFPFFNLVTVHNFGVSFGMFNDIPHGHLILSIIAIFITLILFIWMWRAKKLYLCLALGLITGGAIGNIIDRMQYGAVADFLDFHLGNYHWPAFNIADSAVFIGVAMILLEGFISGKGGKHADRN